MKIVAVVGDHAKEHRSLAVPLGQWLAGRGVHLLTGGGGGVMAAVSQAFFEWPERRGLVLGVLPAQKPGYPNEWVVVPIRTHLHGMARPDRSGGEDPKGDFSRNHINALTADVLIALPGGRGSLAELELALSYGKRCFALLGDGDVVGGQGARQLGQRGVSVAPTVAALREALAPLLPAPPAPGPPSRGTAMSDGPDDAGQKPDLVLTPGGPRPREYVHAVRSGEVVRFDEAGKPVVGPRPEAAAGPKAPGAAAAGLVLTPGGYRPRALVHRVGPREALHAADGRMRLLNLETGTATELPQVTVRPEEVPALGSGWITDAYWTNATGRPVTSFRTTWQVPPAPATQGGQTIFLFNGIVNTGTNYGILQPVLQWGSSAAGGGPYWTVASWYVTVDGHAFHTSLVRVNPGDTLVGVMTLTGQSGSQFSYNCEFAGVGGTGLPVQNIAELVWLNETLEAYSLNQCSDYPATNRTAFRAINIQTGAGAPAVTWTPENRVTDCGQHAVVVSNSPTEGEVDLYYTNAVGYIADKVTLGDTALGAPALANVHDAQLALAWTGTDSQHRLNVMSSPDGRSFGGKVTLGETSIDGPALAFGGGRLFLAWTGTDGPHHLNVLSSADGQHFVNKVTLGETSPAGPALAFGNGRLFLAWTGTDSAHSLNVLSSTDGIHFTNKVTLRETSYAGPGLSFLDGKLYLLWSGEDSNRSLNILESADGVNFSNKVTLGDSSYFHPAMARGAALLLGWTGRDSLAHLNVLSSTTGTHGFGKKVTEDDRAAAAPALALFRGQVHIAWTGTDSAHHLNVAGLV